MSTEAAQTTEAAAPAEAATETTAPVEGAKPAEAKPAEAKPPEEAPKRPFSGALAAERKAREATAKARQAEQAAEARAKAAEEKFNARVAELEAQAAGVAPLIAKLRKKDSASVREALGELGLSAVDIAKMVADEGRAPTADELVARAREEAVEAFKAEQKKRDDEAAAERKKADEARAKAEADAEDQKFVKLVTRELESATGLLGSAENAEKYAVAHVLDKVLPAIGLDRGATTIEWGQNSDGSPRTVTVKGGSPIAREAVSLALQIMSATADEPGGPTRISMAEAIERVQKAALAAEPRLQQLTELPKSDGKTDKKNDQKKSGGAAQPTLSTKTTTGPVVDAVEEDRGSLVDARSVRKAALAALPHLRQHFAD